MYDMGDTIRNMLERTSWFGSMRAVGTETARGGSVCVCVCVCVCGHVDMSVSYVSELFFRFYKIICNISFSLIMIMCAMRSIIYSNTCKIHMLSISQKIVSLTL